MCVCVCAHLEGTYSVMTRMIRFVIGDFQSRDKTAMLVHKTIANYGSRFA